MKKKRLLIIGNSFASIANFRGRLADDALSLGHAVTIASDFNIDKLEKRADLAKKGISIEHIPINSVGIGLVSNLWLVLMLARLYIRGKPDVVLACNVKSVVFCSLLGFFFRKVKLHSLITGLGFAFIGGREFKRFVARLVISVLYRWFLRLSNSVIFQNPDDKEFFTKKKFISQKTNCFVVGGSGVDLAEFEASPAKHGKRFLMVSRLLFDKGIREYVLAANLIKNKYKDVEFFHVGSLDNNPSAITLEELNVLNKNQGVVFLGFVEPIKEVLRDCNFFVLPSYREGMPRSTLEALAMGKPVITTNVPGCRGTVVDQKNGFLIQPRNVFALARAMLRCLRLRNRGYALMCRNSICIARAKFDLKNVNKDMLRILDLV